MFYICWRICGIVGYIRCICLLYGFIVSMYDQDQIEEEQVNNMEMVPKKIDSMALVFLVMMIMALVMIIAGLPKLSFYGL